jgi:hypothetical protein
MASSVLPLVLLALGFLARLGWSAWGFLNPDEAAHYLLSVQPSLALVYKASLTTAHPPLLIVLLHYCQKLGNSEILLRLPSVLAGSAFCWIMFRWMEQVAGRGRALVTLALLLFSPSLISLSAEVRQYSLLLCFCAGALYLLDRSIAENSPALMAASGVCLYLAMLSHYSALIFALTLGIYGLLRLRSSGSRVPLIAVWSTVQAAGVGLATLLYFTHVSKLKDRNLPQQIADTWLRNSIFHRGDENVLAFIAKANLRVFHFDFGNNVIGVLGLVLFIVGIVALMREPRDHPNGSMPGARLLGCLLVLPFPINCALAVAGAYPYGGTRHNALLAAFAMCGVSAGICAWKTSTRWAGPLLLVTALLVCNIFPSPAGAYIKPRNQDRRLMLQAARTLEGLPRDAILFTDYQSGLLLSYYLCKDKIVQFDPPFQDLMQSTCAGLHVVSTSPRLWIFEPGTFPKALAGMQRELGRNSETRVWIFQAGWLVNDEPLMRKQLENYGCEAPQSFGENILLCELKPR